MKVLIHRKKFPFLIERDMRKIQGLGKREAAGGVRFLKQLFTTPTVTSASAAQLKS